MPPVRVLFGVAAMSLTLASSASAGGFVVRSAPHTVGVHPNLLRGIEPFPTQELKPYDAAFVSGWLVERYQIDLVGAAQRARAAMDVRGRRPA